VGGRAAHLLHLRRVQCRRVLWYSLFGALLFSAFIIFDTWKIANILSPDDYIIACNELYLDIINLFLYILSILGIGSDPVSES